jgi:hypothetical protein
VVWSILRSFFGIDGVSDREVERLTEEQIKFLNEVCRGSYLFVDGKVDVYGDVYMVDMNLTEIPVKFGLVRAIYDIEGRAGGQFRCSNNKLTTLKNCPDWVDEGISIWGNPLNDYFKNIKEGDFPLWDKLYWGDVLEEYPFLINHCKKYNTFKNINISHFLDYYPLTKLYYKD